MTIDPPVGPYSPIAEIESWIRELEALPPSAPPDDCLRQARG